jgi:hypothetical protein
MTIWGLERAIGALLLLILGEFSHHFVEVHPEWDAQFLHDPIKCTFGGAIVLYLHDIHQERVQQCARVVKVCEHYIPSIHELGLQACRHGCGEVKIGLL